MIVNRPEGNKLSGFYLGRVVEHLKDGRYKVFIPGVYPDKYKASSDYLPPAVVANDVFNGGINGDGQISYINNGTTVYCVFANGDLNCPVIMAVSSGGNDFTKILNLQEFSSLVVDPGCALDYKHKDPVAISKRGKTMIKQAAGGLLQMLAQRNMTNSIDAPNSTYSHSMHMLNTMYSQGRVLNKNYLVFSNNPKNVLKSEIRYRQLVNRETDGDNLWFIDHFNDDDEESFECIGISCVISPKSDEAYLVGDKIDCPKAGIQNEPSWNRQLYSSWGGLSHESPCIVRGGTTKNVYINCDGNTKFVEFASKNGADLYICNGEQYGFIPQYWDKHFQGSYPPMCPQKVIPPPVLADAGAFNINIYLLDPYKVTSSQTVSEDGSITLSVHNQKNEYEKIYKDNGNGQLSSYEFIQNGEYAAVLRSIDDYYLKSKTEDIKGLSSYEVQKRYGYVSATEMMETTEISSIKSLSCEILKLENLTASWANPDSVTRASYEGGDRADIDISNYSNIHSFERYLSPDDTSSHISSVEYFTRNEHCPIRGIITSYMSTMLSVDLNDGSREDRIMSVWNVPEDTLKHWNGYRDTISTETRLLSSWRNPTSDNTEDSISGYQLASPRSVQDIEILSSLDKNAGSDNSVKLSCETGTSFTKSLYSMASKVTQGGGGNSATKTDLAEETRSTELGEVKRDYSFKSGTVVKKDGASTETVDKLEKNIDVKLGNVKMSLVEESKTDASLDNMIENILVKTGDVQHDYTLKTLASNSLIAKIESKDNVSASAAIAKKTVTDVNSSINTLEEFDAKNGKITISITGPSNSVKITLDSNGNININGTNHLAVTIGKNTLDMDKSGATTLVAPDGVEITGNTHITGTLEVTGLIDGGADIIAKQDCKASGCTLNTHVHTENQSGDIVAPGAQTSTGH